MLALHALYARHRRCSATPRYITSNTITTTTYCCYCDCSLLLVEWMEVLGILWTLSLSVLQCVATFVLLRKNLLSVAYLVESGQLEGKVRKKTHTRLASQVRRRGGREGGEEGRKVGRKEEGEGKKGRREEGRDAWKDRWIHGWTMTMMLLML